MRPTWSGGRRLSPHARAASVGRMMVASRARMRRALAFHLALVLTLAGAGCARRTAVPPPVPPVAPRAVPGYEGRVDSLAAVDASGLAGRRIALDPGHGGFFRGALGVNGLTEAEVNLGVALRLRDLLAARGARVFLTRDRDLDFTTPADSSLRSDLAERTRLAGAFAPDLFVSIHHNADAGGRHDVNETQTYYKLGDDGPSLDVAQDIHRALVRNVGIRPHKVVPGNYFVLRGSEAPAVLTETSYITNPDVEERLRLPEKQQLEAEALFMGIARYFVRPAPVITRFAAEAPGTRAGDSLFASAHPRLVATVRGAFDEVALEVDGAPQAPLRVDSLLVFEPRGGRWSGGPHEATLRVRLNGVGSALARRVRFAIAADVARLEVDVPGGGPTFEDPVAAVRILLREASGAVHRDTTVGGAPRVRVRRLSGDGVVPRDTVLEVRDGVAWGYFRRVPRSGLRGGRFQAEVVAKRAPARATFSLVPVAKRSSWTGFALHMPEATPLREARSTREPEPAVTWINRDGFAVLARDTAGRAAIPQLPGFRAWGEAGALPPRMTRVAGGVLHGRRITLDPEGGGEDPAGVGVSGTRASHLNLETARILGRFLTAAGAEVHFTRPGDVGPTEIQRVQGSEAFRAERYLRIGHRARRFGYYFSSPAGRRWATGATEAWNALGLVPPPMVEDALYPLQQTSCPALYASPARVDSAGDEQALLAPGALRAEAYALYLSLAREWAPDARWEIDSLEVRDDGGAPVQGALVTLGGALVLETDARGRVRFARTEPGPLEAVVDERRVRARAVLLDSTRGAILTGPRGG